MPAPLVLPAPSPPAPTTTQGSTFTAVGGCRLLVRLSLSVFRLVLVMVSLVVQMVGGG